MRPFAKSTVGDEPAQRRHRRLAAERGEIGADEAGSGRRGERDRRRARAASRGCGSRGSPGGRLRPARRRGSRGRSGRGGRARIDRIRMLVAAMTMTCPARLQPVHEPEKLGDDAAAPPAGPAHLLAFRRDGVELVDEDDRGRLLLRLVEDAAELCLARPVHLVDDLGAVEWMKWTFASWATARAISVLPVTTAGRRAARPTAGRCRDGGTLPDA